MGATLAFSVGFITSAEACGWKGTNIMDAIPSDVVANVIIATAAAVGSGVASSCAGKDCSARSPSSSASSFAGDADFHPLDRIGMGSPPLLLSDKLDGAGDACLVVCGPSDDSGSEGTGADSASKMKLRASHGMGDSMLIVHAGSSTTYPVTLMEFWNTMLMAVSAWPKAYRLSLGMPQPLTANVEPDPAKAESNNTVLAWKVWLVSNMLRWVGVERRAPRAGVNALV